MIKIKNKLKKKISLHPIMTLIIMMGIAIVLSGLLTLLDVESTYMKVKANTGDFSSTLVTVENLFSLHGLKYIFTNTVSNFVAFVPLSSLIIILIGIGVMEKSGFLRTSITLLTKSAKKNHVTFFLVLACVLASMIGDLAYIIMIPIAGLLYKYGRRNPRLGIITAFAALTCGSSLNIVFSSVDVSLMSLTKISAHVLDGDYTARLTSFLFIMIVAIIAVSLLITYLSEKYTNLHIDSYEFEKNSVEEELVIGKKELKGLVIAIFAGIIYMLIILYNVIPGLPFSGNLLDNTQLYYIEKLFSPDSFFSKGFVFIVTMLFVVLGFFYGLGAKTIKNHKDLCEDLGHSLDSIGSILILIFFAATFIGIFKQTNIGMIIVSSLTSLITKSNFSGIPLIIMLFIASAIATIVLPGTLNKWTIMSGSLVPFFMNSGISPEFTQLIFRFGEVATLAITPMFAYFVIYLAYLESYNQNEKPIGLRSAIKMQLPYSLATAGLLLFLLIIWYIIGLPLGLGSSVAI